MTGAQRHKAMKGETMRKTGNNIGDIIKAINRYDEQAIQNMLIGKINAAEKLLLEVLAFYPDPGSEIVSDISNAADVVADLRTVIGNY